MPRFSIPVPISIIALTAAATVPVSAREVASNTVHVFSEGYLQMVGATDTTATRGADGVWRVTTVKGSPENWSKPHVRRLDRRQARVLESLLDDPSSYLDDPGPDPNGVCLDPWSMSIEWSWRSKTHAIDQQCGPWGVADRISRLLAQPAR